MSVGRHRCDVLARHPGREDARDMVIDHIPVSSDPMPYAEFDRIPVEKFVGKDILLIIYGCRRLIYHFERDIFERFDHYPALKQSLLVTLVVCGFKPIDEGDSDDQAALTLSVPDVELKHRMIDRISSVVAKLGGPKDFRLESRRYIPCEVERHSLPLNEGIIGGIFGW